MVLDFILPYYTNNHDDYSVSSLGLLSIGLCLPVVIAILFRVANPYPKAAPIIVTASTGRVNGGSMSTFFIMEYDSKVCDCQVTPDRIHLGFCRPCTCQTMREDLTLEYFISFESVYINFWLVYHWRSNI